MAFLDRVLQRATYGWKTTVGLLIKPLNTEIWKEFFTRLNVFSRNQFWRFLTQNLTISVIPEEIYVISPHVHHSKSDQPGDPYNAQCGFLYCFLADVNHQPIAKDLDEPDYNRVRKLMAHTGVQANTFRQYLHWGSYVNPYRAILAWLLNWSFWYLLFYQIGGNPLACSLFGAAGFWAIAVRTVNYEGHGKGKNRQRDGIDYNRKDESVNQLWPGIVAGECITIIICTPKVREVVSNRTR